MLKRKVGLFLGLLIGLFFVGNNSVYAACTVGSYLCAGNVLKVCRSDGLNHDVVQDCGTGNCDATNGKCINTISLKVYGASCNNATECASDGCYENLCTMTCNVDSSCPSGSSCKTIYDATHQGGIKVCKKNSNPLEVCTPGTYKCGGTSGSSVVQKCSNTGGAWNIETYCNDGTECNVSNGTASCVVSSNSSFTNNSANPYNPFDGCSSTSINTALGCIPGSIKEFTTWLLSWLFGIAGGIAFLLMSYGFILIATSGGDEKKVQGAKETITSAVVGLLVCIFSIFILRLIAISILKIPGI